MAFGIYRLLLAPWRNFWPEFVEFEGYILRNLDGIQHIGCPDISKDKLAMLGKILKEIYEAKLQWQFPDRPCIVTGHP